MKILLDHCMDVRVKGLLGGHEVSHTRDKGWQNLGNGTLLTTAAAAGFAVMVTADKNIRHQQNLAALPLAILELDLPRIALRISRRLRLTCSRPCSTRAASRW